MAAITEDSVYTDVGIRGFERVLCSFNARFIVNDMVCIVCIPSLFRGLQIVVLSVWVGTRKSV